MMESDDNSAGNLVVIMPSSPTLLVSISDSATLSSSDDTCVIDGSRISNFPDGESFSTSTVEVL